MRVLGWTEREEPARVYIAGTEDGRFVEFVESVEPPIPREEKWVLIVSTLFGCPVRCLFCDAGGSYAGPLDARSILFQIDRMVRARYPAGSVPAGKFKVQFARMGEPALNDAVLKVLEELPARYDAPGLMPALSTIAPAGREGFFERLLDIRRRLYGPRFQLQFSIHSTDRSVRDRLVPAPKWDLAGIASYGERFHVEGGRKIALNFALEESSPLDPGVLLRHFDPERFMVKITPVNPTLRARESGLESGVDPETGGAPAADALRLAGYDVIVSVGELEENRIGSNCGQLLDAWLSSGRRLEGGYGERIVRPAEEGPRNRPKALSGRGAGATG